MIHAPGPLPGRPLTFLKRVLSRKKTCRSAPFGLMHSSLQSLRRQASPVPILPQPDFGREQNPKRPHRSPPTPTPARNRKSKGLGQGNSDLSLTPPKG